MKPYYQDDLVTIYHGDCREVLPTLQIDKVNAVVADPPYNIHTKSDGMGKVSPWADWCNAACWFEMWLTECRNLIAPTGCLWAFMNWRSIVTYQRAACNLKWPIESLLVWDKEWIGPGGQVGLRPSYEMVGLWAMPEFRIENRGIPDIRRAKWSSHKPHGHPAEKPIDLVAWLMSISIPKYGAVLDPFMGSGTTLVAAKRQNRVAVGVELDERYCEIAAKRLSEELLTV